MRDKIGNTAVLYVRPDGKAKFVESKDWGAGRGALLGGAIGILGGPLGIVVGGSVGALVSKLRDSGFKNDQLEQLGKSLEPNSSAIVVEIASDAIDTAKELEPLGAQTSSWKISTRTSRRSLRKTRSLRSSPSRPRHRASLPASDRLERLSETPSTRLRAPFLIFRFLWAAPRPRRSSKAAFRENPRAASPRNFS